MNTALFAAAIPLLGLTVDVAAQIVWLRLSRGGSLLRSVYAGFLAGAAAVCAVQTAARGPEGLLVFAGDFAANLIIYAVLGYGYFHFINLGETGRRTRILRELYDSPAGLTLEELLARYNSKHVVALRLERLLDNRQIVLEGGYYRIGRPAMLFISGVILFLKKAILGRSSEFKSESGK